MKSLPLRIIHLAWLATITGLVAGFGYLITTEIFGIDRYHVKITTTPPVITRSSLIPPPTRTEEDDNFDRMCRDEPDCRLE